MTRRWCLLFVFLMTGGAWGSTGASKRDNTSADCTTKSTFSKVMLDQTRSKSACGKQYVEYVTQVPTMTSFTLHYWILLLEPTTSVSPFSYISEKDGGNIQVNIVRSSSNVAGKGGDEWVWVTKVKDVVVSVVVAPPNTTMIGRWHHVLHSWHGHSGAWSIYLDGHLLATDFADNTQGFEVTGGGRAFSGLPSESFTDPDTNDDFYGWLTLVTLDSHGMQQADYWMNRLMVSLVVAGCSPEYSGGNIMAWHNTPSRSYGGAMTKRANPVCGKF